MQDPTAHAPSLSATNSLQRADSGERGAAHRSALQTAPFVPPPLKPPAAEPERLAAIADSVSVLSHAHVPAAAAPPAAPHASLTAQAATPVAGRAVASAHATPVAAGGVAATPVPGAAPGAAAVTPMPSHRGGYMQSYQESMETLRTNTSHVRAPSPPPCLSITVTA